MQYEGIDVSVYQGVIDWAKVAQAGVRFAMVRAGSGEQKDSRAAENAIGANQQGIVLGFYWFSYAYTVQMAINEAKRLIRFARAYNVHYPLAWDFEDASVRYAATKGVTVDRALVTAMAQAFCQTVYAAGYMPMLYTNVSFLETYVNLRAITAPVRLWLARWETTEPGTEPMIWQYTSNGRVDGIGTAVDRNRSWWLPTMEALRLQTLADVPTSLRAETQKLIDVGALRGDGQGLDITLDMLRAMIVSMRYTDAQRNS